MKPHIFKSRVHPGQWACVAARPTRPGCARKLAPVTDEPFIYGDTPTEAYKEWMRYFAPTKEAT